MASEDKKGIKQKKKDISSLFLLESSSRRGENRFRKKKRGFLERKIQLFSRFPGVWTVGSRRAKKQSCSTL